MPDKEFKLKYKIRNRAAKVLKRVIAEDGLIDTGTLYDSVRINAKFTTEGNLRIEILAAYYFGFLNNGTITIEPYDLVRSFNVRLEQEGIISEMYASYIEWLSGKYPLVQVAGMLRKKQNVIYDFNPLFGDFFGELEY
jgi:hypothetical protein|tara:strand:+ start:165 stop:578 length:414 start_codon:yes stop_codon:yes gene_type:complete